MHLQNVVQLKFRPPDMFHTQQIAIAHLEHCQYYYWILIQDAVERVVIWPERGEPGG